MDKEKEREHSADLDITDIGSPIEAAIIENPALRFKAYRKLAKRWYDNQASYFARGKERFDSVIEYDPKEDVIRWNGSAIKGSKRLKSNLATTKTDSSSSVVSSVISSDVKKKETENKDSKSSENTQNGAIAPSSPKTDKELKEKQSLTLVLMVKNESHIIERALTSIKDDIDGFVILDTGSTDNTVELIWSTLVKKFKKRGEIYLAPWFDFGTNRCITVQLAYNIGDWLLLFDADYKLLKSNSPNSPILLKDGGESKVIENKAENKTGKPSSINSTNTTTTPSWKKNLPLNHRDSPSQILLFTEGNIKYARPHIVSSKIRWCYQCRTHEFLAASTFHVENDSAGKTNHMVTMDDVIIDHVGDGGSKNDKAHRDIVLLLMDLLDNPKSERAYFYLGNSLRAVNMNKSALNAYHKALNLCSWKEEIVCACRYSIECLQIMGEPLVRQAVHVLHGNHQNPQRLELPTTFMRLVHQHGKDLHNKMEIFMVTYGSFFVHNQYPNDQQLFIDVADHNFNFWHELFLMAVKERPYFMLACFLARKTQTSDYFQNTLNAGQREGHKFIYAPIEKNAEALAKTGIRNSPQLVQRLIHLAHEAFANHLWRKAKVLYEESLMPVVRREILQYMKSGDQSYFIDAEASKEKQKPDAMINLSNISNLLANKTERESTIHLVESFFTAPYHRYHPLTAWRDCKSVLLNENQQNKQNPSDIDNKSEFSHHPLVYFQLAKCAERIYANDVDTKDNVLLILAYLVNALKIDHRYSPAIHWMNEMTLRSPSVLTRCICYLLRLVTHSKVEHESMQPMTNLHTLFPKLTKDQSTELIGISPNGSWSAK